MNAISKDSSNFNFCRLVRVVQDTGKYKDRRDFLSKATGVRGMFREVKQKLHEEEEFSEGNLTTQGQYLLKAKKELRRVSHIGSSMSMDDFWEGMMKAEPGTHHVQYVATFVNDVQKSVELLYAQNMEILHLLKQSRDGISAENGSLTARTAVRNERTLKGTTLAKEIRKFLEPMLLEQPLSLRGTGKNMLSAMCQSRLLWPELSYEDKVRTCT